MSAADYIIGTHRCNVRCAGDLHVDVFWSRGLEHHNRPGDVVEYSGMKVRLEAVEPATEAQETHPQLGASHRHPVLYTFTVLGSAR